MVTPFMGSAMCIALSLIVTEFTLDAISLGIMASSYLLATAIFLVPFGRCADNYGRKRIFTLDVIAFCTLNIFASLARGRVRE